MCPAIDAPGDEQLEIVRGMKGVVHAFYLTKEILEKIRDEEATVSAMGGSVMVDNVGYSEAILRENVICIVKDPRFRPPPEPTVVLESGGKLLGVEVFPFSAQKYLDRVDVVWLSDAFVLFPLVKSTGKERFIMPPVSFPELNPSNGCRDVVSCSPAPTCDQIIREEYGLPDDPKLASVLVAFNRLKPGETAPEVDPVIQKYLDMEAEAENPQ